MIFCLIVHGLALSFVITGLIAFLALRKKSRWNADKHIPIVLVGLLFTVIMLIAICAGTIDAKEDLAMFIANKEYIESYEPTTEYDNAAVISKKIELNEWLFKKQYIFQHYPIITFYTSNILDIQPIK